MTPNRQYPLGVSISPACRQRWIQAMQMANARWWLIEDDYDNEFVYQGRSNVPFMQTVSVHDQAKDRVFFVGSFSKVLFRGLRLGFIVAPAVHVPVLQQSQRELGSSASLPIQPAVADFMLQGHFDRHLNRMRRHYRLKRDALLILLEAHLTAWCDWKKPRGGMHVMIEIKPDVVSVIRSDVCLDILIAQALASKNIVLSPLSSHYAYTQRDNKRLGFLLGFSGPTEEKMKKIITALADWFIATVETHKADKL